MAKHTDLARKVSKILLDRGKTIAEIKGFLQNQSAASFQLEQTVEADGPIIKSWNVGNLGAEPTIAELDAMDSDQTYTDFKAVENGRAGRPNAALAEIKNEALLKTFLTEDRAATLARTSPQKENISILCIKALMIDRFNNHIEDMQA